MSQLPRSSWYAVAALLVLPLAASAQLNDVSGAGFYPFRGSARTIGLAGAFTAISDDAAGMHFNPAGMTQIDDSQAEVDLKVNADGENYFRLAFVQPIRANKYGGGLSYLRASDGTGRTDKVYQFTYGQEFQRGVSFGINLRYHEVKAPGASDEDFSFDIGALYQPPSHPQWSFGAAVLDINEPSFRNIGLAKRIYNLGVAYRPDEHTVLDLDWYDIGSQARRGSLRFGGERVMTDNIVLRAGVGEETFGVGVSLRYTHFTLDYGFQRVKAAPDLNMLSVLANF